ncbi:MAG TPA: lipopolysaccharide biosynthesis protein [Xanthobacteraceae bacterium]|jgi:O-antigen/teichoic acid export membrane protein
MPRVTIAPLLKNVLIGSAAAFLCKLFASALGFAMFALSSRAMDQSSFGSLAIYFNALAFISVAALAGQETLVIRSWDEYRVSGRPALARGVLGFSAGVSLSGTLSFALATGVLWAAWDRTAPAALIASGCAFLLLNGLLQFTSQLARVVVDLVRSELVRELSWRLLAVAVICFYWWRGLEFGATQFFSICAIALSLAITVQVWQIWSCLPASVRHARPEHQRLAWSVRSFKMWIAVLLDVASQYLEVVFVGFVLGPGSAAFYFVITRITSIFAMISAGVSIYASSRISALYYSSARPELQQVLRALAIINLIVSGCALLIIIVAGKVLLWFFGPGYVSAYEYLMVMGLGAAAGTLAGPARHVLLLTGHEGVYAAIMGPALVVRMLLITVLGLMFGLGGTVVGWSLSTVLMTVALIVGSRRLVGVDPSLAFAIWQPNPGLDRPQGGSLVDEAPR